MLEDRPYMKSSPLERRPATISLLIALVAIYVLQSILAIYANIHLDSDKFLGLSLEGVRAGKIWQLFTFQFLHQAPVPWHLLFNCLGLYFFGRAVEDTLGSAGFLRVYFLSGLFGGIVQLLTTLLPRHMDIPVVGASAGVMGLLGAYATLFPTRDVTVFIFVFPITLRAQYLFWGALIFSLYGTIVPFSNVAHAAHLGGILMGVAYIRWGLARDRLGWHPFQTRHRKRELVKAASVKVTRWSRPRGKAMDDLPPEEFISREVDPILDKISAHGIQSLTPRERQILEAARAKMERR
jgi:membrane associated rhomboid family serine protease